ncbi:MAG TPA: ATP-binding protein [Longimicrobiales bacterium]|nr:ATP-binding protein [Longimicrobiales bacterium]
MQRLQGIADGSTLRGRLLLALLLLSLLPLFGTNALGYLRSRIIIEDLVARYLDGLARVEAAHVRDRLEQRRLYLEALVSGNRFLEEALDTISETATSSPRSRSASEAVREYLSRQVRESGQFAGMALLDETGEVVASTAGRNAPGESRTTGSPDLTVLRRADSHLPPVLRFTIPVGWGPGEPAGYLEATIPLERGNELLEIPQHIAGSIESFVLDAEGRPVFISHAHGHADYGTPFASPLVGVPPGEHAVYLDRAGVEVIGSSAALPDYGWLFLTEIPVEDAFGELQYLGRLSVLFGTMIAVTVVVIAVVLARRIVAPVRRLVGATRALGGGDLGVRVPAAGGAEIAELGAAFNQMADELSATQKQAERLHRREIERAGQLATVGELASGVAHEIKNPMVGISNGLDLILRRVADPELKPIAREMQRQLNRIEGAVSDLLTFARPREPRFAPVSVMAVIRRAVTLVEPGAGRRGVEIVVREENPVPLIRGDGELLEQGLVNLLVNAVAFSPPGSEVMVVVRREEGEIRIRVQDRGPGMDPDTLSRIFKPFFTTRASGTGLGLPITLGIAERHGGRLEVESERGEGTTFTLALPEEWAPGPEQP